MVIRHGDPDTKQMRLRLARYLSMYQKACHRFVDIKHINSAEHILQQPDHAST